MEETRRKDKREEWKKVEEERRKAAQEEQHRVEEEAIQKAREEAKEFTNSLGMKFVLIPAGTFMMGSLPDEIGRRDDEKSHVVIVSSHSPCRPPRSLRDSGKRSWGIIRHVLRTAGTTVLWRMCSGMTHRGSSGSLTGWRERTSIVFLPRQSGSTPAGPGAFPDIYFGDDRAELREYAWYSSTSDGKTHPVGQKKPIAWGLYDMIGNVWEWCQDWYTNYPRSVIVTDPKGPGYIANRVLRGGAWSNDEWAMRSAVRDRLGHGFCSASIGFRFARDA